MDGRSEYFQHSFKDEMGDIAKEIEWGIDAVVENKRHIFGVEALT